MTAATARPDVASPRALPYHAEAEISVLGGAFLVPDAISKLSGIIEPEDFYAAKHQDIAAALWALAARGEVVDLVTVAEEMRRAGALERAGGTPYLAALLDAVPTAANVTYYARLVKEYAARRSLLLLAAKATDAAHSVIEPLADTLRGVEEEVSALARDSLATARKEPKPLKGLIRERLNTYEQRLLGKLPKGGVPTGFRELDAKTGGMFGKQLWILAGRPGMGKTSLALAVLRSAAGAGYPAAMFSLEMGEEELAERMLCSDAGLDQSLVRVGSPLVDWQKLMLAASRLVGLPIVIDDTPALRLAELRSKARRLVQQEGVKLIVVDYLQIMRAGSRSKGDTREREVAELSAGLKALSKELDVPVLALAQLNRGVENRDDRRPRLSDLRESGGIEQDADVVLFVYREEKYKPDDAEVKGKAEIIIGKQRNGAEGVVDCFFEARCCRFHDDPQRDAPPIFGDEEDQGAG